jgi:hypothetical protein
LAGISGGMMLDTACTQQTANHFSSYPLLVYKSSTYEWDMQNYPQQQSFSEVPQQQLCPLDGALLQHNAGDKNGHRLH